MTVIRLLSALVLFALLVIHAPGEHLSVKTYTIADGLARDFVNKIKQDPNGYIWFCTSEGISRFDGYTFRNYGLTDGLPHRVVNDMVITRDGAYLFATDGGLVSFDPVNVDANGSHFTRIALGNADDSDSASDLLEDADGSVWCSAKAGLFRLTQTNGQWSGVLYGSELAGGETIVNVGALLRDRSGSLWIGTGDNGVFRRLPDGRYEHYTAANGLAQNGISDIFQDRDGTIWVGTGLGLTRLVADAKPGTNISARNYTTADGLLNNFIETLFQSSDGRLWIGTRGGVSYLADAADTAGHAIRGYGPANGMPNIRILTIFEDRDHNVWIGAENGGASKIPLNGFVSFLEADGFGNGRIGQIFADRNNAVYALAFESSILKPLILRYDGSGFVREKPPLPDDVVLTWGWNQLITQDRDGEWWLPTARDLYRFSSDAPGSRLTGSRLVRKYGAADGIDDKGIFRLYEDARGGIWFSTLGDPIASLHRLDKNTNKITIFPPGDDVPRSAATAFVDGPDGDVWVGFYTGGVARFRDGKFTMFSANDGVPAGFVRHLFIDSKKRLWIATSIGGVGRVDDVKAERIHCENLTTKDGISSDQVTTVAEDKWGRIYLGTGRGIDRLDPDGKKFTHFTTSDGLPDNFINVSFTDHDGSMWFGTLRGLAKYVPQPEVQHAPPTILISGLTMAGERKQLSELGQTSVDAPDLSYSKNQVQIEFVSLSYSPGETVKYQYQFENATDWSTPTEQRSITFPNLAAGDYRFLVRAVSSDGSVSTSPASVTFRILPPIWERWWFILLCVLLFGGVAIAFYRYRMNRLREVNLALEEANRAEESLRRSQEERIVELEKVRSRIATDLHDDIGASLTQISILSEVAAQQSTIKDGDVARPLEVISGVSNELVSTMSDIVWAINPERDHLQDLIQRMRRFASDVLSAKDIEFDFNAPAVEDDFPVGTNLRREVFLIFKESLNNIVKHASATKVEVDVSLSARSFDLTITDNGKGFAIDELSPQLYSEEIGGNGVVNMRRRAAEMEGEFTIISSPGSGTTVRLSLPLDSKAVRDRQRPIQSGGDNGREID